MNLLAMMKQEISELHLTDKLEIAYYLYMRTGQLFEYDPIFPFLTKEEKENFIKYCVQAKEITDKYLICFSWSYLYRDLLLSFGIDASVVEKEFHAFVTFKIVGEKYVADLMNGYEDLFRIKVGLPTLYFGKYEDLGIHPYATSTSFSIANYKNILFSKRKAMKENWGLKNAKKEYSYLAYKMVEKLMNEREGSLDFITGEKYISYLLYEFINEGYCVSKAYFYDHSKGIFLSVYEVARSDGSMSYFSHEKRGNGLYSLQEVPLIYVQSLKDCYSSKKVKSLSLPTEDVYERCLSLNKISVA